jgi:hypothetical protein
MSHFRDTKDKKRTLLRILHRFWWPSVNDDVFEYIRSCVACAQRMPRSPRARAPLRERERKLHNLCNVLKWI